MKATTAHQRERIKELKIQGWLGGRFKKRHRDRCFETLDTLIARLRTHDPAAPITPDILAELLLPFLRADRTIAAYFKRRASTSINDPVVFEEIHELTARGVVDRYIADRKPEGVFGRGLTVLPEFLAELDELLIAAVEAGKLSEAEGAKNGEERYTLEDVGDLVGVARARIEKILETEANLGQDVEDDDVPKDEQEREIAKAALKKLRANELRSIASKLELLRVSDTETLIDAIARKADYNLPRIAELILNAEDERIDLGAVSRLIPLKAEPDFATVARRLALTKDQWVRIRTRPAHWFIPRATHQTPGRLTIRGDLKGFAVEPVDLGEDYRINATPREEEILIQLRVGERWAQTNARRAGDMRAISEVLYRSGGADPAVVVPLAARPADLREGNWDPITLKFLDFLTREFGGSDLFILDFKMANFETSVARARDAANDDQPAVSSVRLRGKYLDAHREACQLVVEGRRLIDVELTLAYRSDGRLAPVDCRFSLRQDHAVVATGIGTDEDKVPTGLHRILVEKMRLQIPRALGTASLNPLLKRMQERARQTSPAHRADMISKGGDVTGSADSASDAA